MKISMPLCGAAFLAALSVSANAQTATFPTSGEPEAPFIASDPFSQLDKNHDGFITKDEAKGNQRLLRKPWAQFDKNKDGKIDSAEFAAARSH
ncbi:MAG: hypothetical protein QM661_12540 [Solimonas sp.]